MRGKIIPALIISLLMLIACGQRYNAETRASGVNNQPTQQTTPEPANPSTNPSARPTAPSDTTLMNVSTIVPTSQFTKSIATYNIVHSLKERVDTASVIV